MLIYTKRDLFKRMIETDYSPMATILNESFKGPKHDSDEASDSPLCSSLRTPSSGVEGLIRREEESREPPLCGRRAPGARDATRGASAEPAPLLLSSDPPPGSARGCVGELDGGAVRPQRRPD